MATDADREVRLAEFNALRQEMAHRGTVQQAILGANLAAIGALGAVVVGGTQRTVELLLILPVVTSALALLWIDHHLAILRIGRYIGTRLWTWKPGWERWNAKRRSPVRDYLFWLSMVLLFPGVSIGALFLGKAFEGPAGLWVLSGLGVVLTVIAGCALFGVAIRSILFAHAAKGSPSASNPPTRPDQSPQ